MAIAPDGGASVLGHVGYFAELIDEWAPEAHADERLYRLGKRAVATFETRRHEVRLE